MYVQDDRPWTSTSTSSISRFGPLNQSIIAQPVHYYIHIKSRCGIILRIVLRICTVAVNSFVSNLPFRNRTNGWMFSTGTTGQEKKRLNIIPHDCLEPRTGDFMFVPSSLQSSHEEKHIIHSQCNSNPMTSELLNKVICIVNMI